MWGAIFAGAGLLLSVGQASAARKNTREAQQQDLNARIAQAEQSWFRTQRDLDLERERIDFEISTMSENADLAIYSAEESLGFDIARLDRSLAEVSGSQTASAAAAGLRMEGSTLAVYGRSKESYNIDVADLKREFSNFRTATLLERDQFIDANELSYTQYKTRTLMEADYEIANLLGKYNTYDQMSEGEISTYLSGEYQTGDQSQNRADLKEYNANRKIADAAWYGSKGRAWGLTDAERRYVGQPHSPYGTIEG